MSLTAISYLLVFGGLLTAALLSQPRYGLYAYLGTFYLSPSDRWWGAGLPDLRWSLIAATVTFVALLRLPATPDRPPWTASPGVKILLAFSTWIWVQNLWALSPAEHWELSILFTKYLLLWYLIYRLVDSETTFRHFLIAHVLGCLYLGVLILQAPDNGRLDGMGGPGINEANALGMHLATGMMAAAALLVRGPWLQRIFALVALALLANGIVQTESRGAFLAVIVGGLILFTLSPLPFRRTWLVLGGLGAFLLIRVAPEVFWDRMTTLRTTAENGAAQDQSSTSRLVLLGSQWQMFLAYPAGAGHRGTAVLSPRYLDEQYLASDRKSKNQERQRSSHNTLMTVLTEQGLPGAVLFTGLVLWVVRTSRATSQALRANGGLDLELYLMAVASSLGVVLAAGMFTDYLKAEAFMWNLALLAAVANLTTGRSLTTPRPESPAEVPS